MGFGKFLKSAGGFLAGGLPGLAIANKGIGNFTGANARAKQRQDVEQAAGGASGEISRG